MYGVIKKMYETDTEMYSDWRKVLNIQKHMKQMEM